MDETPAAPDGVPPQPMAPVSLAVSPPPEPAAPMPELQAPVPQPSAEADDAHRGRRIAGVILILLGLFFYAQQFLPALSWAIVWPAILIVIGIYVLLRGRRS